MKKIKLLLITGVVSREHPHYRNMNEMLRTLLLSTGRFEVKITEEFHGATPATLASYDALLVNYDGKYRLDEPADLFDESAMQSLLEFVRNGKGIGLYHSSLFLDEWPDEYRKMAGYYLMFTEGSRKNPKSDACVYTKTENHPIAAGAAKEWMAVEDDFFTGVFRHPEADPVVLAAVRDEADDYIHVPGFADRYQPADSDRKKIAAMRNVGEEAPVMWINTYGKGRVFATTLGHSAGTVQRVNFLTMFVRGMEWAATGEVTLDFPDRSGENRFLQWPFYQG